MVMRSAKYLENSMTVRRGYAHQRSAPRYERAKMGDTPLKQQGQERHRGERQKATLKINPCEIRELTQ